MDPITLGLGLGSLASSLFGMSERKKAQRKQEKLLQQQQAMAEQEYYANLQRHQEWAEKYGSIEHNMISYVQHLDPAHIAGIADSRLKKSYETARQNIDSHLAERGFDVAGGVHADMFTKLADMEAQAQVQLQAQADQYVQQQRQSVLAQHPEPNQPSTAGISNSLANQYRAQSQFLESDLAVQDDIAGALGGLYQSAVAKYLKKNNLQQQNTPQNVVTTTQSIVGGIQ